MREKALVLGDDRSMIGISSDPEHELDPRRPALIVLNSGLVHRIGPYRVSVKVTRRAAQEGFLAVRFDLSGVGDSEARRDASSFEERWIADTRTVMDHITRTRGVKEFVLMGLCSGADNSFQTARRDERVVGVVLLDGYAYKTPGYYARYYGRRALDRQVWKRFGRSVLERTRAAVRRGIVPSRSQDGIAPAPDASGLGGPKHEHVPQYVREFPARDQVAANLRDMIARGVRLYFIHSGGMERFYNYEDQLRDAFTDVDFQDRLTLDYFANADHTFTELHNQRVLIDSIGGWLRRSFPAQDER